MSHLGKPLDVDSIHAEGPHLDRLAPLSAVTNHDAKVGEKATRAARQQGLVFHAGLRRQESARQELEVPRPELPAERDDVAGRHSSSLPSSAAIFGPSAPPSFRSDSM